MDENADQGSFQHTPERKRDGKRPPFFIPAIVWLMLIFFIGMILGNLLWLAVADVLAFGRANERIEITITQADSMADIAHKLKDNGLIAYPWLFRLYAAITNAGEKIKPGTYVLNAIYDYPALVDGLG